MSTLKVTNIAPQSGSDVYLTGSLTISETLIAKEIRTELTQSVTLLQSGSTQFGDTSDDTHTFTGDIAATGELGLTGNLVLTGSILSTGSVTLAGIPWPSIGSEHHLIETQPFTVNLNSGNRDYAYLGVALEHFESSSTYHNSFIIYAFDDHVTSSFGTEFNVGPTRTHMRVFPSGSSVGLDKVNMANISIQDLENGSTQALVYGNKVQIGVYNGDEIDIGNLSASLDLRYDEGLITGNELSIINSATIISGALGVQGVGNVSSSIASLNTRLTTAESELGNTLLSSSAQIAGDISGSFTSTSASLATDIATNLASITALDDTYATDAQVLAQTASLSSSLATGIATNTADIVSLTGATGSYASTGSNTFTGNQIVSASVLLTLQQLTGSSPIGVATGSLIVSGSPVQLYIYNGSGSGWNRV
jgi:hypothetical protein